MIAARRAKKPLDVALGWPTERWCAGGGSCGGSGFVAEERDRLQGSAAVRAPGGVDFERRAGLWAKTAVDRTRVDPFGTAKGLRRGNDQPQLGPFLEVSYALVEKPRLYGFVCSTIVIAVDLAAVQFLLMKPALDLQQVHGAIEIRGVGCRAGQGHHASNQRLYLSEQASPLREAVGGTGCPRVAEVDRLGDREHIVPIGKLIMGFPWDHSPKAGFKECSADTTRSGWFSKSTPHNCPIRL